MRLQYSIQGGIKLEKHLSYGGSNRIFEGVSKTQKLGYSARILLGTGE